MYCLELDQQCTKNQKMSYTYLVDFMMMNMILCLVKMIKLKEVSRVQVFLYSK